MKEISKRMIETVKARSSLADDGNDATVTTSPVVDAIADDG
jgi:hypothetical protein